jgi:hypothetical protein
MQGDPQVPDRRELRVVPKSESRNSRNVKRCASFDKTNLGQISSNGNCEELPRTCDTGRDGSSRRSTNINNNSSSNKNSIGKNPVNNGNPNNKTTRKTARKTTRRPADIPPIMGVSLIVALIAIIVVVVAGADPWVIVTLAAVVLALASRIR